MVLWKNLSVLAQEYQVLGPSLPSITFSLWAIYLIHLSYSTKLSTSMTKIKPSSLAFDWRIKRDYMWENAQQTSKCLQKIYL